MPGQGYPADRVATKKYEQGPVKQGNPQKEVKGTEGYKPSRGGQDADDK